MIEFAYHSILSDYKINWRLTSWCNFRCEYCQQKKFEPLLCVSDRPCTLCGFVGYDNNKERLIRTIKNKRVFLD